MKIRSKRLDLSIVSILKGSLFWVATLTYTLITIYNLTISIRWPALLLVLSIYSNLNPIIIVLNIGRDPTSEGIGLTILYN